MKASGSTSFISLGVESKGAQHGNLRLVEIRAPIVEAKNESESEFASNDKVHS
jgi:hypothetical protein